MGERWVQRSYAESDADILPRVPEWHNERWILVLPTLYVFYGVTSRLMYIVISVEIDAGRLSGAQIGRVKVHCCVVVQHLQEWFVRWESTSFEEVPIKRSFGSRSQGSKALFGSRKW